VARCGRRAAAKAGAQTFGAHATGIDVYWEPSDTQRLPRRLCRPRHDARRTADVPHASDRTLTSGSACEISAREKVGRAVPEHVLRRAAEDHLDDARVPVRADEEQVVLALADELDDPLMRIAGDRLEGDGELVGVG
jgi:hypothetical protein